MPNYQYICKKCGKKFFCTTTIHEHETRKPRCPKCSSHAVETILQGFFAVTARKT
jgi:putative FmdB family regulatory protein